MGIRMSAKHNVAILGASGYTGAETIRLVHGHPNLKLKALSGHSRAGQKLSDTYPNFGDMQIQKWEDIDFTNIDMVFACLPHGASQETIAAIKDDVDCVVDLSADFRLADPALYEETYGRPHAYTDLLETAIYGLTEFSRDKLKGADLIACPGCYPTCSLLSLLPGIEAGLFNPNNIIIDAKSGVTGAGRKAKEGLIYSEVADGAHAYGVGSHRHAPEIDQMLKRVSGQETRVSFTPHLIPMNRGMITTSYVRLADSVSAEDVRKAYAARYKDEPFIRLSEGVPQTRHVRASNLFGLGVFEDRVPGQLILVGVIDNLVKGSAGQAVQNYNVAQGWDETLGLEALPVFP